ncbi:hypothetical protein H7C19_05025 [Cohnella nanjingensis]|uniref:Uncharacterized protein n=2 Tax=Cohnella nanjingensis TaxID=1387779 RepID=A0A7X0RM35_9BACL|nr:hypothetical protein [Cohnella nanjingensis]
MLSSVIPAFAGSNTSSGVVAAPVLNERVVNILEKNNVDFKVQDGNLKLVETSPESIAEVNKLIASEFNAANPNARTAIAAVSYPTPYTHMKQYDIFRSKKFEAASKTALAAAVIEWAKGGFLPNPYKISVTAAGGFAVYYFLNTEKEDLYFAIKYYYREFGPGRFDSNGNFYGDYDVKKEIRVTKNSDYTGGNVETEVQQGTIIEPWF